jgi:hypothetical protein
MHSKDRDSHHSRWRLLPNHLEELTDALRGGGERKSVTAEQRRVIRTICSTPERFNYTPEDFLIAFKLAIVDAANAANLPAGPDRNDLLAKLVSVYIEEFYRSPGGAKISPDSKGAPEIAPG